MGNGIESSIESGSGKEDEVQIVFKNATLKNTEAPLLVDTEKSDLTLADGTKMKWPMNQHQRSKGHLPDSDLTINGKVPTVTGAASNAIKSKTAFAL